MRIFMILPLLAAVGLSGCVGMSRSSAVAPLSADWTRDGRITEVRLQPGPALKVTPQFKGIFETRVQGKLTACAKGDRPLRLEARIDRLDKANPVITTVIAGANVLRGQARIVDIATGRVVGDYAVGKTIVGGRFAIIAMGQAEEQMSDAFGDELCKQAFTQAVAAK